MSDSQRIKHEGTYSTWKIHQLTREGRRDGCLLGPIRVERLPRNFTVLKKRRGGGGEEKERNDFVSRELVAGCLMTHRLAEYILQFRLKITAIYQPISLVLSLLPLPPRPLFRFSFCFFSFGRVPCGYIHVCIEPIIRDINRPTCDPWLET